MLSSLPFVTVATRYQYCRIQPLSDIVDLGAVPDVQPQFRVVEIVQRITA